MSIYKVSASLTAQGIKHTVIAASEEEIYMSRWLVLLATVEDATKAVHRLHWNVRGHSFMSQHASYFQPLYEYLFELTDKCGEKVKQLDHEKDVPFSMSTMSDLGKSYTEFKQETKYTNRIDRYLSYTNYMLGKIRFLMLALSKLDTESNLNDLGGQNFLSGQVELLDAWIWKAKASIQENMHD